MLRRASLERLAMLSALGLASSADPPPQRSLLQKKYAVRKVVTMTRFDKRRVYVKLDCGHEVMVDWDKKRQPLRPGVDWSECKRCPVLG